MANGKARLNIQDENQMNQNGFFSEVDFLSGHRLIRRIGSALDDANGSTDAEIAFS